MFPKRSIQSKGYRKRLPVLHCRAGFWCIAVASFLILTYLVSGQEIEGGGKSPDYCQRLERVITWLAHQTERQQREFNELKHNAAVMNRAHD
jgi:hypothetical protein